MTLTSFLALFWQRSQEKQINASCWFTHLQHHARHRAVNYGGVSIFPPFPVFNEVTGALKEFIFTNFAPFRE